MKKFLAQVAASCVAPILIALAAAPPAAAQYIEHRIENPDEGFSVGVLGTAFAVDGSVLVSWGSSSSSNLSVLRTFERDQTGEWVFQGEYPPPEGLDLVSDTGYTLPRSSRPLPAIM